MKKTWIKVKRGLLEPKHRRQLGAAWFLYLYMLDMTNWKDGIVYDWKDGDAAADLEMPVATLRDHRRKLEDNLYISTKIKQYGLEIRVNNWTNPREYSGKVYNQVDENTAPQKAKVKKQVNTQVDTQVNEKLTPLHINHISHDTYHTPAPQKIIKQTQDFLDYFILKTNLKPPKGKLLDSKWLIPLTQMLDVAGFDLDNAKRLLALTIKDCDKTGWSFSTPYQIQSRYNGFSGKQKRKGGVVGKEFNPKDIK